MLRENRKFRLVLIAILSCALLLSVLFGLMTLITSVLMKSSFPNGMSFRYREYAASFKETPNKKEALSQRDSSSGTEEGVRPLQLLRGMNGVTVFTLSSDGKTAGLYDPRNEYMTILEAVNPMESEPRAYFTTEDYEKGAPVKLPVRVDASFETEEEEEKGETRYLEVIPEVPFYHEGMQEVWNLTSLPNMGHTVWIDGVDDQTVEQLGQKLENAGYVLQDAFSADLRTLVSNLSSVHPLYSLLALFSAALYFLGIVTVVNFTRAEEKRIALLQMSGLAQRRMLYLLFRPFAIAVLLGSAVAVTAFLLSFHAAAMPYTFRVIQGSFFWGTALHLFALLASGFIAEWALVRNPIFLEATR